MNVEYINPFLKAAHRAFETMLGCTLEKKELSLKSGHQPTYEFSGIIGLTGKAIGTCVLSLSREVAYKATSTLLMMPEDELTKDDVVDAVGELANVVAGAAKAELEEFSMSVSLPNVVIGTDFEVAFPSDVTPIIVHFECPWGPLCVEVGFAPVSAPVR